MPPLYVLHSFPILLQSNDSNFLVKNTVSITELEMLKIKMKNCFICIKNQTFSEFPSKLCTLSSSTPLAFDEKTEFR
jgi:hypothetical protein